MAATRIQTRLLRWYRRYGRASLPWRTVRNPYRTVVSEFMLAQTQVERVVPSFEAFVTAFPNFAALASAPLAEVLRRWKGLGYNSRAVRLHEFARVVFEKYGGVLPSGPHDLRALPGMGPYSVAAVLAFAFNRDAAPVDTNVRRIVHRLYYGIEHPPVASARELDERARSLVPTGHAHDWSSALMDLGASLCTARAPKCPLCPVRSGCAAAPIDAGALEAARVASAKPASPQNAIPYARTRRFARGRIIDRLRDLPPGQRISLLDLHGAVRTAYTGTIEEVREVVEALERDGLISHDGESVALRE